MSRVDAVRIAVEKAREHGHSLEGAALASDAFFPFADGPAIALEAGIGAIIQPGGSKRDDEVVAAVARGRRGDGASPAAATSATRVGQEHVGRGAVSRRESRQASHSDRSGTMK